MSGGFAHERVNTGTVEWYTPSFVFETLDLTFDVDVCHPEGVCLPWIPAKEFYTRKEDGLAQDWMGKRFWMNPPYGEPEDACVEPHSACPKKKCVKRGYHVTEWQSGTVNWLEKVETYQRPTGMALLFARTDPDWFHDYVKNADGVLFLKQRIRFVDRNGKQGGSPGSGSMLVAWGEEFLEKLREVRHQGPLAGQLMTFVR